METMHKFTIMIDGLSITKIIVFVLSKALMSAEEDQLFFCRNLDKKQCIFLAGKEPSSSCQQIFSSPDAYLTSEYFQVSKQLVPLYVGFTVLGLGICFGYNCGYAVNPARDLAPRLFTALAGWGPDVFAAYSHW